MRLDLDPELIPDLLLELWLRHQPALGVDPLADKLLGLDADADCRGYGAGPLSRGGNLALSELSIV